MTINQAKRMKINYKVRLIRDRMGFKSGDTGTVTDIYKDLCQVDGGIALGIQFDRINTSIISVWNSTEDQKSFIELTDIEPNTFKQMLKEILCI